MGGWNTYEVFIAVKQRKTIPQPDQRPAKPGQGVSALAHVKPKNRYIMGSLKVYFACVG